jgi:hypothetical protein
MSENKAIVCCAHLLTFRDISETIRSNLVSNPGQSPKNQSIEKETPRVKLTVCGIIYVPLKI